jgi:tRNA modification GTPase
MDRSTVTVAILTPPGRGAVATVSVQGPHAVHTVQQCFTAVSGKQLANYPLRRIVFGRWHASDGPGEELVVCRVDDERVEVHCHGGAAAVETVVAALESCGAVRLSPDDWLRAEESDLIAAEAHAVLAEAKTERTALILLDQYHGALRREVETILDCFARGDHATAQLKLTRLQQLGKVGQHLTTPWRIAIVGPPNVGKSSLMNALVGYSRSIVFDQPGTTRDLIRAETAFDGWPVELIDTAGLRATGDAIESAGVDLAQQAMASADLCLRIRDAVEFAERHPRSLHERTLVPGANDDYVSELAVYNKIDLLPTAPPFAWPGPQISAKTGQGVPELMQAIVRSLLDVAPLRGEAISFTPRQIALVSEAHRAAEEQQFDSAVQCLRQIGRS